MKHIVALRFSAMGDVAMTVPVLRAWARANPEVRFTLLTRPLFTHLITDDLPNLQAMPIDISAHKGVSGLWSLCRKVKALDADVLLDLHDVLRTKVIRKLASGAQTVVFKKGRNAKAHWIQTPEDRKPLKHTTQRYAEALERVDFLTPPVFPLEYYEKHNQDSQTIAVAPFAQHLSKQYGLNQMEEVICELSKSYTVELYGGGDEQAEWCCNISDRYPSVTSMVELSFAEQLEAISKARTMLSMDSANAHLAGLYNVPVVTVWGGTHPDLGFGTVSETHEDILPDQMVADRIQYTTYGKTKDVYTQRAIQHIKPIEVTDAIYRTK